MKTNELKKYFTREVYIGKIAIGNNNPIAIQSMINTQTQDIEKSVDQIIALSDKGLDIIRISASNKKDAYAIEQIKNILVQKGYNIPIVADVHFDSSIANVVIDFVEKVRINPGNYVNTQVAEDKLFFQLLDEKLFLLINKCKIQKKAIRIGINHGSLSPRIISKYGNTIEGMVVSALEFIDICKKYDFHDLIFSMKSSNVITMKNAYKSLVNTFIRYEYNYPLHLGVTEAGNGKDAIIKSSIGIGALLLEGIGDTIRYSITGSPLLEITPAQKLIEQVKKREIQPFVDNKNKKSKGLSIINKKKLKNDFNKNTFIDGKIDENILYIDKKKYIISNKFVENNHSSLNSCLEINEKNYQVFHKIHEKDILPKFIILNLEDKKNRIGRIKAIKDKLSELKSNTLLIANFICSEDEQESIIEASMELGYLLIENIIDGIYLSGESLCVDHIQLTLDILQASRKKISKTEYISCPGCSRTLYNHEKLLNIIQSKTNHLPNLKIAVMGCYVNGPGEMADADYGFVGGKKDKVHLYKGKFCVEKDINLSLALEKLIDLLKKDHKWIDIQKK